MRRVFILLLILPSLVILMGGKYAPLYDPQPIAIPEHLTAKDVVEILQNTIVTREWIFDSVKMPEGDQPGKIRSTLHRRAHTVTIEIIFDSKQVDINYASSVNLDYNERRKTIHNNCNRWIRNLEKYIRIDLGLEWLPPS